MNAQQFISYMKDPRTLDRDSLGGIEELASEFPYCQSLRILHLLNLRMVKHVMYSEQLKTTSAYIADRRRLKELIREMKEEALPVPPEDTATPPEENVPAEAIQAREEDHAGGDFTGEAMVDEAETPVPASDTEAMQYDIPAAENRPAAAHSEPVLPMIDQDEEARLLALREIVDNRLREISREKDEALKQQEKASKEALIDKFIREEPSISRPKAEFFDPVRMARSSQVEHEGVVSETLARIHLQQGNIAKAIEIYRRLSLNFPEKSSYFAAQIKKIKSEN